MRKSVSSLLLLGTLFSGPAAATEVPSLDLRRLGLPTDEAGGLYSEPARAWSVELERGRGRLVREPLGRARRRERGRGGGAGEASALPRLFVRARPGRSRRARALAAQRRVPTRQ